MAWTARDTLLEMLDLAVADVAIRFVDAHGSTVVGGRGLAHRETPPLEVRVTHPRFYESVLARGNLGMGEAFVSEDFHLTQGGLEDFLGALVRNRVPEKVRGDLRLSVQAGLIRSRSWWAGKRANIAHHYDVGVDLFESFLDPTLTYSCGYARDTHDDLHTLQLNKLERICQKLRLCPGERLLDIGCGFGGLLIYAAATHGVRGVGISNSRDHVRVARERVRTAGLDGAIQIEFGDYADAAGSFDKVVSVGMMEHVPRREYSRYIRTFRRVMGTRGLGLIHTIGCAGAKNRHDPFIQHYIFPGSNQPRLSEIAGALEKEALPILDVENLARHYYHTVRHWLQRFRANRGGLDGARYTAAFQRVWEYYLCCGIAASLWSESALFQVLFAADCRRDVPLVRV